MAIKQDNADEKAPALSVPFTRRERERIGRLAGSRLMSDRAYARWAAMQQVARDEAAEREQQAQEESEAEA